MPRPLLLTIAALALAGVLGGAGCADDVSPAARVGDRTVSHDDLLTEVDAWASSPTLIQALEIAIPPGSEETGYATRFVDIVLSNRVAFELHNDEFEARGLELTDDELEAARGAVPAAALDEMGEEYADLLVADIARQFKLQQELAEEYPAWAQEAFTQTDVEVSSRYGRWDPSTGTVLAPTPPGGPDGDLFVEL